MKKLCLLPILFALACGGNLSDEQRKKLREGMEQQKIVRVTEAEIMSAALDKGHVVLRSLENLEPSEHLIDSVEKVHHVNVRWTVPGGSNALAIEQELIAAYIAGLTEGATQENLQKVYNSDERNAFDSLLYSKPKITKFADGSEQLDGLWNIYISKKDLVLDITKSK